ncbi:hypothetical protein B0T24DRAFT_637945 [Lasiosphaeria ovina]|uniref:Uncharacterized protein n=1 Tax=Lasiosphaeria ovina TaxID=92902 RepID=A0AAE0N0E4_9PEZI|nr:hypothetical protein B0T24DRAFT_637945 [Lasiosphaeria ovina]
MLSALRQLRREHKPKVVVLGTAATTSPTTVSAPGAPLLASYLLLHIVLPRLRAFTMEGHENVNFKSGLRPPNGYHVPAAAPTTCLQEITDSQSNSRIHTSTMAPPQQGIKRAFIGNMSQPDRDPKRKTLMEMAGEPTGASRSQLPSAPPASARIGLKGNTIANLSNANVGTQIPSLRARHIPKPSRQ